MYMALRDAVYRCYNTKNSRYDSYGERGITVCEQWRLLPNPKLNKELQCINRLILDVFVQWSTNNGWQKGLQLDRIDNDGNYCPENCRWTTRRTEQLNRRKERNTTSIFRGVCFVIKYSKWKAATESNNKTIHIGMFDTELDAAKAYNQYIIEHNLPQHLNTFTTEELLIPVTKKRTKNYSSSYFGVCKARSKTSPWKGAITINGKGIHLGVFKTETEAAQAYDNFIITNNLDKPLNFNYEKTN